MIQSLSLCAQVTLALHNLNSEGTEGNQQHTRMVHVIDASGARHCVNAVSGDIFKHFYVGHLTAILRAQGQPLSVGAAVRIALPWTPSLKTPSRGEPPWKSKPKCRKPTEPRTLV